MKLNIERGELLKSLGHIQSVVERRNTIPILSNVLLESEDGRLNLAATDLDIAIGESVVAETQEPGGITAPAHTLYDIVRKLPEKTQIKFKIEENKVYLNANKNTFELNTFNHLYFPALPKH